jgi:uncharacterized protein (TIGR02145 family)
MRSAFGIFLVFFILVFPRCTKVNNLPGVLTSEIAEVTQTTAESGGYVSYDGGDPVISRGVCWSTERNPTVNHFKTTDGSDTGKFVSRLTGLKNGTVYYVRAYANNINGTGYGAVRSFKTGIIRDIEGNIYNTVLIGRQLWMAQNLRTMKYHDGTEIPLVPDNTWKSLTIGALCFLDNDLSYKNIYGGLYNYYAVANSRKICPDGWHVPSISEWDTLINNLGGRELAGASMKETGTQHWITPNTNLPDTKASGGLLHHHLVILPGVWR